MSSAVLLSVLGPRQAQIMQYLWAHGPATVRELHDEVAPEVGYQTVLVICRRLVEKGLLERRGVSADDPPTRCQHADVYAPRVREDELVQRAQLQQAQPEPPPPPMASIPRQLPKGSDRATIERLLVYVCRLRDEGGWTVDAQLLAPLAALLERAEAAEQAAELYQAEALRALHRAAVAERGAENVEGLSPRNEPKRGRARPVPSAAVYEYRGAVCRVCGRPAPLPSRRQRDDLRVCALESCRKEARRCDAVISQRRSVERRRAHGS